MALRTIRSAILVPPADKMSARHIAAFAKAAAHLDARILLKNGLLISPDGSFERLTPQRREELQPPPSGAPTAPQGTD